MAQSKNKTERVIIVHFTGRDRLQLHDGHVPKFVELYKKGVKNNTTHFISEGKDKIIINMDQVTFIEETDIEVKEDEQETVHN